MNFKLFFLLITLGFTAISQNKKENPSQKYTISGYIKDAKNGESLIGSTISKQGTNIGASANEYGFYSITLPQGEHIIVLSLIGYQTFTFALNLDKNITKNFELTEESKNLEEVVITGEAEDKNVNSFYYIHFSKKCRNFTNLFNV